MASKHNRQRSKGVNASAGRSVGRKDPAMPLTPQRLKVLDFTAQYTARNRYAPTYQEIADGTGLTSAATVHFHVNKLMRAGLVKVSRRVRSLELTAAAKKIVRQGSAA